MSQLQSDILSRQRPRRAWDETLPDGRTLAETIRAKLMSPTSAVGQQAGPGQQVRYEVPDRHGALPQPVDAPTGGTTLPQPVDAPKGGAAFQQAPQNYYPTVGTYRAPQGNSEMPQTLLPAEAATDTSPAQAASTYDPSSTATRPWKVAGSLEKDPLKRDASRIRAMIENPISKVNPDGSVDAPHPMSKKKAILLGLLQGMGEAARGKERPSLAGVLAGGATGAAIGAVKPKAIQEWRRRMEVDDASGELGQQQKIAMGQATLEEQEAQTRQRQVAPELERAETQRKARYDQERLKIQQDAAAGRISTAEATRKLADARLVQDREQRELDRESRKQIAAEANVSRETVAGLRGATTGANAGGTAKREAKIAESQTLYKKAENLDQNAATYDEHIKKLQEGEASVPEFVDIGTPDKPRVVKNPARETFKTQLKALRDEQRELKKEARKLRVDGDKARAAGEAVPETSSTPGRGAVKPGKDGKFHYSLEQIRARSESEGANYEEVLRKLRADRRVVIDE